MNAFSLLELAKFISDTSSKECKELSLNLPKVDDEVNAKVALAKYQMFLS